MTTKLRAPMSVAHTAGIFSDMTVDGPEIGTLVAIVDRAKNLPNRKTIGKQDPYCAARLGKEAKKTTTDIRGGQTPKWDQELRFTVHDSPDYYQLKVSVFNDDKKTDLIGETWIDLRDIIVGGGGQSDLWHTLTCKGKYAGELRMEITYYDTRPKPEKPAPKSKPVASDAQDGQRASRTPVKRRPLPSDPVTGEAPAPPPVAAPVSAPVSAPAAAPEHAVTPPRALPKQSAAFIPNQSPLQAVEYGTPSPGRRHQQDAYSQSPHSGVPQTAYGTPPARLDASNPHTPRSNDRHSVSYTNQYDDREYSPRHQPFDRRESRGHYSHPSEQYEVPSPVDRYKQELPGDDDKPPPPPVHRSRHNSSVNAQDVVVRPVYETSKNTSPMRHDILKQEAHRRAPSYPGRPAYRPYETAPSVPNPSPSQGDEQYHHPSPPRHHSYDNGFDPFRSMQPTVEDVPESPSPSGMAIQTRSRAHQHYASSGYESASYEPPGYASVPTPAPLNLSGRRSGQFDRFSPSPQPNYQAENEYERQTNVSPLSFGDHGHSPGEQLPSRIGHGHHSPQQSELQGNEIQVYGMPSVPPSLVPGVDPALAQEVSDRIHEERRQQLKIQQQREQLLLQQQQQQQQQMQLQQQQQQQMQLQQQRQHVAQSMSHPPRGRQPNESSYGYGGSPQPAPSQSHDRAMVTYSSTPAQDRQLMKARSVSPIPPPNPNHTIKRKSVSPAPPPAEGAEGGRRLSGVPFGPDSYDMLNPSVATEKDMKSDPDAKIITHDGREIDPSDHLPMDTWAPEPEPKGPKAPGPESTRQRPGGAQPMPPSGRRPLRISGRPHSQSAAPAPPPSYSLPADPHVTPGSGGRNRLQKKNHRASAGHAPAPAGSSPLAPMNSYNYQDNGNTFTPSRLPRASTWDYPNENHAPQYGSSPGAPRGMAPPVPAKVPLPVMSGGIGTEPAGQEWALVQEMSRIDIGAGRSRRHGGY